ncbi:COX15/CtaA family protein [Ramlibacter alkalitolerans]|uniref:COX15/CtaA family protein n=1 Tax=Ramlibacter alkalitolerans TaxID=2039631 RepID=A0ABS1JRB3_9BURK|nr:COX15/CtaA family protein [Ramlibacter alkalitolerans]MBL0426696.1 COX15/CtaA family protein [Ramlibacter alkalitolerans]
MVDASLYDFSPVLRLALLGIAVASGPLAWVWLRNKQAAPAQRLAALTLLTLFLTFDLVLFGAFTRLTDSGLGCPDWPGCYGNASPTGAIAQIRAEEARMPTGPVTHGKAWVEMVHRYLATGVGVLITTLAIATWLQRKRGVPVQPRWPALTLAWVCLQGAFGALTVTMKLFPAIVTLHLLGGMVLLALLAMQAVAYRQAQRGSGASVIPAVARHWLLAAYVLLWLQVALGGWVSTNYAVLACSTFPACQGSWWPAMDFRQGFELWRPLGMTGAGETIHFAALTAIHYAHRLVAYAVFVVIGVASWRLRGGPLHRSARAIGLLLLWQFASGLSNVVLGWPLLAAVAHTGGAAALVVALTWALRESRGERAVAREPAGVREVSA